MIVAFVRSIAIGMFEPIGKLTAERKFWLMFLFLRLPSAADGVAEALDVGFAEVDIRHPEKRGHRLLGRIAEVGSDHVREYIFARALGRLGRIVYVAGTILTVLDQRFLAEYAKH
jgi:hypothetical protein